MSKLLVHFSLASVSLPFLPTFRFEILLLPIERAKYVRHKSIENSCNSKRMNVSFFYFTMCLSVFIERSVF